MSRSMPSRSEMQVSRRSMLRALAGAPALLAACRRAGVPAAQQEEYVSAPPKGPVSLTYWDWAEVWRELIQSLATRQQERRPGLTVDWQIVPDYWNKLQASIAGGTAPDSWRMNGPNLPAWVSKGLLADLTPFFNRDKAAAADLQATAPVFQDYTRRQGKQWSVPFGNAISGILAYNVNMLQAEGLQPPAELGERWRWPLLAEYAVRLTRADGSRHGYHSERGSETGWLPYLYANGGALFSPDGKKPVINTPEARETFEYLVDFVLKLRAAPAAQDLSAENATQRFLTGKLAIVPRGSWETKDLNRLVRDFTYDIVPIPRAPRTGKNGSTSQLASVVMNPATRQQGEVWEWLRFIGSKEGQDIIARAEFFPARLDSAETIYYDPRLGPAHRPLLREVLRVTQPLPYLDVGNWSQWGEVVNPLVTQMFNGQIGVREALQKMQEDLTAAIERGLQ